MVRSILSIVLAATVSVAAASPLNYGSRKVSIKSAVVQIASQQFNGVAANDAPFALYNLDSNRNIKPGGWTFYNPSAPSRVTQAISNRWLAISGFALPVDEPISKRTAPYWELDLANAGEAQIAQYDLLLVPSYRFVALNSSEREKLRRFVEGGGVLWVDLATSGATTVDPVNGFPLPFTIGTNNIGLNDSYDFLHPIFNRPNTITSSDLYAMASENTMGLRDVNLTSLGFGDLTRHQTATEYDSALFLPVAEDQLGTKIAVGQIGEGYMVVTSRGLSRSLNQVVDPSSGALLANAGPYARVVNFSRGADAAAKLVVNMVHLAAGYGQIGKGSRKTNGSNIDLGAPMLKAWDAQVATTPGSYNYIPPTVFKGRIYAVDDGALYCFDAKPSNDQDLDGDPDDGVRDYAIGSNRDLIWSRAIAGPMSPPTCAEVPGSGTPNQVAVVNNAGQLVVVDADTGAIAGTIAPPSAAEVETGVPGRGPYAPTYHDGLYVVADQVASAFNSIGRVWIANAATLAPLTSSGPWMCGGTNSPIMLRPSASPTVGYIPIADGSGGLDRVVYVPTRPATTAGPGSNAAVHSLWLGAKGEKPYAWAVSGGKLYVTTRANLQGLNVYLPTAPSPVGFKLTIIDDNGNPLNAAQMDTLFTNVANQAAGLLIFDMETGQNIPTNYSLRIDYSIDWGISTPGVGTQILRGNLFLPDNTSKRRRILGSVALAPDGTIHVVHSDPDISTRNEGGCYYAFREEKRGEFKMRTRYELFQQHTYPLNQAGNVTYAETFRDGDPLTQIVPFLGGRFNNLRFIGPPTIQNGIAYVPAASNKGFIPTTILCAFRADPPVPEIVVGDIPGTFTLVQPDLARSDIKASPNLWSVFSNGQYVYEREGSATRGTIRLESLMNVTRGFIGNSINLSQPIIIRRNGQPDQQVEPNLGGDRWSPLLWFTVLHGWDSDDGTGPVLATGNTVFLAGKSALPYFVTTAGFPSLPPPTNGMLIAMNGEIPPNDPFLISDSARAWQKQLIQLKITGAFPSPNPNIQGNSNIRWPQYAGLTSFDDWRVRLLQTVLDNSTTAFGVVGGDNVLASWSELGVWAFNRADYIVCDDGRLARFDGSGNPVWTADAAIKSSIESNVGAGGETKPLVRPTKAYVLNDREMIVVDTGSNRVVRLDVSGRELRSIDGFNLDPGFAPDGYVEGASRKLREPRDVLQFDTYENNPPNVNNPQAREFWKHYVVADSGNKRLLEIVDRYRVNPTTGRIEGAVQHTDGTPALGVLWWHSPSSLSGKDYDYNSLARVFVEDTANPGTGVYVYAAGIGTSMPTRVDLGLDTPTTGSVRESSAGNGGIVVFNSTSTTVINEVTVPAIGADVFYNPSSASFLSPAVAQRTKRLGNLRSVTMRNVVDPLLGNRTAIMFADAEGVFEIVQPAANGPWVVRWMMPKDAYRFLRRTGTTISSSNAKSLTATYARRLDSGEVLIVNGYVGQTLANNDFKGEVVTVDGTVDATNNNANPGFGFLKQNLGFNAISVKAELPPIQGARGLVTPVFADRR